VATVFGALNGYVLNEISTLTPGTYSVPAGQFWVLFHNVGGVVASVDGRIGPDSVTVPGGQTYTYLLFTAVANDL